jgi:cyclopropane fatty-acyl-phospholipid synthase-like methyltransferase
MPEKPKKFLSQEEHTEMAQGWKENGNFYERHLSRGTSYKTTRFEGREGPYVDFDVAWLHQQSFIRMAIPELIKEKSMGEKVTILELGSGAGVFAEQIRQEFGDAVKVYTTGLRKKAAKIARRTQPPGEVPHITTLPIQLNANDLKWRSISELSDFPEFDLIIDTIGEVEYRSAHFEQYFDHVGAKLLPGGEAYIVFFYSTDSYEYILSLTKKYAEHGIEISALPEDGLLRVRMKRSKEELVT